MNEVHLERKNSLTSTIQHINTANDIAGASKKIEIVKARCIKCITDFNYSFKQNSLYDIYTQSILSQHR